MNGFKIDNSSSRLVVSSASVGGTLKVAENVVVGGYLQLSNRKYGSVTGWFPVNAAVGTFSLLSLNGVVAATVASDVNLVTIPAGAVISQVRYAGVVLSSLGAPTYNIGIGAFNAVPLVPLITVGTMVLANSLAGTAVVGASRQLDGAVGTATGTATVAVPNTVASNFLSGTVAVAANVGNLKVEVDYYI